ncbi:hypothetical protein PAMP_021376 [Pampus punctatissimus]
MGIMLFNFIIFLPVFYVVTSGENCTYTPVFTPSTLVVKFGDPASATCSICQPVRKGNIFGLENPVGKTSQNKTSISWTVDRLTEWETSLICYYNENVKVHSSTLYITLYKTPKNVYFSFLRHTGPMFAGRLYTLECGIQEVAPVENLTVTFYRGQTVLNRQKSSNTKKTPVTETFTLDINPSKDDDGVQYWCEAELQLGAEGPQPPPVVVSEKLTATVYYEPQLQVSSHPDPITVTRGYPLHLNCSAVGNPNPSYAWMLPSDSLSSTKSNILTIESVAWEDEGQYVCYASNDVNNVTVTFNVEVKGENCTYTPVFTPSTLVVKFGDPASATCSICQPVCKDDVFGLEKPVGEISKNKTSISWTVDSLTEWETSLICYYNENGKVHSSTLYITLYKPPKNVYFSFLRHTGPMFAGRLYTLECGIQEVAPVENLTVTFYRGQTVLNRQKSNNTKKTPVTETFSLDINPSKDDDGVQYWCEAELELGAEGPQPPPVVVSEKLTATVYYEPQLQVSSHPDPITVTRGYPLHLNCSAVGNPNPSYTWMLPSDSLSSTKSNILTIESVAWEDKGQYVCYASNDVNNVTVTFNVEVKGENCTYTPVFTPSTLVVKFGDPASATCSICQPVCKDDVFGLEKPVGNISQNKTSISWTVDRLTEWETLLICYYNKNGEVHSSTLSITLYKPPKNVYFSFLRHTGPMFAGRLYTLECGIQEVAPVENLTVTFYRGQTVLNRQKSSNTKKTPVTETFTLDINPSKDDDGVQYWCEAELELGAEGPQPPPVVVSEKLTATVYYEPQLQVSSHPDPITVTRGYPLHLNCSAVGNPNPSYTWMLPSDSLSSTNSSILTIESVAWEDEGQYVCYVSNNVNNVTVTFNVEVKDNYTYIIVIVVLTVAVLIVVCFMSGWILYKRKRMGQYKLKDVFRLSSIHVPVPTVEKVCG